jgi:hypothetical protein
MALLFPSDLQFPKEMQNVNVIVGIVVQKIIVAASDDCADGYL